MFYLKLDEHFYNLVYCIRFWPVHASWSHRERYNARPLRQIRSVQLDRIYDANCWQSGASQQSQKIRALSFRCVFEVIFRTLRHVYYQISARHVFRHLSNFVMYSHLKIPKESIWKIDIIYFLYFLVTTNVMRIIQNYFRLFHKYFWCDLLIFIHILEESSLKQIFF